MLGKYYWAGSLPLLSQADYAALVADFLERLNPDLVMHRVTAAAHRAFTVPPAWPVHKHGTHNAIQRELIPRDAWQGQLYTKPKFRTSLPNMSNEGATT